MHWIELTLSVTALFGLFYCSETQDQEQTFDGLLKGRPDGSTFSAEQILFALNKLSTLLEGIRYVYFTILQQRKTSFLTKMKPLKLLKELHFLFVLSCFNIT